jgi:Zn-dependent protease/CBS domain-containing protein
VKEVDMRGTLRIGRLFGIDVGIDWSWTFVALLMTWSLTGLFLRGHPGWAFEASFVLALVATTLFFASVIAHEFAHALVAKAYGMTVRDIRLFLFGGVSNIEREPPSPGAELLIAIVGPLTSFALGILFLGAAYLALPNVSPTSPWLGFENLGPLPTLLLWLGPINLMVGAFNLVPGFPLDGGRILRAIVWRLTGDLRKSTFVAAMTGRVLGWTFVAMGLAMALGARFPFFGQGAASGLWLALIGWFLSSAADGSYRAVVVEEALKGVRVARLMRRTGYVAAPSSTVGAVVNDGFMRSSDQTFPVVEYGMLLGVVSLSDVRALPHDAWDTTNVTVIMTPRERIVVATPEEDVASALRRLATLGTDQLPVVEGDELAGMLSARDVARWLELHMDAKRDLGSPRPA